jgi:hypothetical protein
MVWRKIVSLLGKRKGGESANSETVTAVVRFAPDGRVLGSESTVRVQGTLAELVEEISNRVRILEKLPPGTPQWNWEKYVLLALIGAAIPRLDLLSDSLFGRHPDGAGEFMFPESIDDLGIEDDEEGEEWMGI